MTIDIDLYRIFDDGRATLGLLFVDDLKHCFTLEDEFREVKVAGETRIPAGRYQIIPRTVGRFFDAYHHRWNHAFALELVDVPNFTNVMLHTGVNEDHTSGCVLVGYTAAIEGIPTLNRSRDAYHALFLKIRDAVEAGSAWLIIHDIEVGKEI